MYNYSKKKVSWYISPDILSRKLQLTLLLMSSGHTVCKYQQTTLEINADMSQLTGTPARNKNAIDNKRPVRGKHISKPEILTFYKRPLDIYLSKYLVI